MIRARRSFLAFAGVVAFLGAMLVAPAAQAAMVQGCTRGFCIDVYTGGKNHSNRTQWVEAVEVYLGNDRVEAWTEGWYRSAAGSRAKWYVGKWVRSGQGVCGATNIPGSSDRKIPCITIRV